MSTLVYTQPNYGEYCLTNESDDPLTETYLLCSILTTEQLLKSIQCKTSDTVSVLQHYTTDHIHCHTCPAVSCDRLPPNCRIDCCRPSIYLIRVYSEHCLPESSARQS